MADWASKANHNNPLFTIYHTLQFAKHKGMYWGEKEVYRLQRPRMREHFRYASRAPPSRTGARTVKDGLFPGVLSPCVILRSSACTFCHTGMFCRRVPKNSFRAQFVTLFQQHCNTSFLLPRCVYRCVWMHSRGVLRCVLLSPLQIRIKMNLFCILDRLQGHRCQLCQMWLRRYWIILCFEHILWMPCRYNTFDGRLLWFDGVEGKRGLTLTVCLFLFVFWWGGGGDGAGGGGSNCFIL